MFLYNYHNTRISYRVRPPLSHLPHDIRVTARVPLTQPPHANGYIGGSRVVGNPYVGVGVNKKMVSKFIRLNRFRVISFPRHTRVYIYI